MDYLSILVASIAAMGVGFAWYSNALFGKQWMQLSGVTKEKLEKNKSRMPLIMGMSFVATLLSAFVLAMFIRYSNMTGLVGGAMVGFWVWLGFVATTMINEVLFQDRRWNLFYLMSAHMLVTFVVMGAVIGMMM